MVHQMKQVNVMWLQLNNFKGNPGNWPSAYISNSTSQQALRPTEEHHTFQSKHWLWLYVQVDASLHPLFTLLVLLQQYIYITHAINPWWFTWFAPLHSCSPSLLAELTEQWLYQATAAPRPEMCRMIMHFSIDEFFSVINLILSNVLQ
jgi:hypothetical protein